MKQRSLPLLVIATLLIALGAFGASCGDDNGGDALTIDEYFSRLAELGLDFENTGDALDAQAEEDFTSAESEEDQIGVFVDFVKDGRTLVADFVDDIDGLNPPDEVAAAHDDAVVAGRALVELFDAAVTVAADSDTFADATTLLEGPGFVEASDRFTETCVALETAAADNGVAVDLSCGDE